MINSPLDKSTGFVESLLVSAFERVRQLDPTRQPSAAEREELLKSVGRLGVEGEEIADGNADGKKGGRKRLTKTRTRRGGDFGLSALGVLLGFQAITAVVYYLGCRYKKPWVMIYVYDESGQETMQCMPPRVFFFRVAVLALANFGLIALFVLIVFFCGETGCDFGLLGLQDLFGNGKKSEDPSKKTKR